MILLEEREQIVAFGKKLLEAGLVTGTFGNISLYNPKEKMMAISPSGLDYQKTKAEDVVVMTPDGEHVDGARKPSSEYDLHRIFYQKRPGIHAVIHTHSVYATTLACLRWPIEPVHYLTAYAGMHVPCIPYVKIGSYALAEAAYEAMFETEGEMSQACLLGNHGMVACGRTLSYTLDIAQQVEFVAQVYYQCKVAGNPVLLEEKDMREVLNAFHDYRQQ